MPSQESERIADIRAGIDEARKGEFATADEVMATIRKYTELVCRPERSEGPHAYPKGHVRKQR